jgi:hypothetical protein
MGYRVVQFLAGLSVLSLLFFVGCEGPTGPQGPQGNKGQNGQNILTAYNLEGFKDSIQCAMCHDSDTDTSFHVLAKEVQYDMSGHRELGNYDRNTNQCAGCHTNEGFYERYRNGFANETFSPNSPSGPIVSQTYPNSSPVGCFTCHLPHRRGNFTVRDSGAVNIFTLVAGQSTIQWNSTPASNLCVKCHQPRMTSTPLTSNPKSWQPNAAQTAMTDTAKINTSRYNNHVSGENVQNLLGFGGVEFSGYSYANYANAYGHTNLIKSGLLGCEDCHMATPIGNKGGGHTFKIGYIPEGSTTESFNFAGCNVTGCHGSGGVTTGASDPHWTKVRQEIGGKLSQLAQLLMDTTICAKWGPIRRISGQAVPFIGYALNANGDTIYYALAGSLSSLGTSLTVGSTVYPSTTNFGTLNVAPAFKAGAIWNLQQVLYDPSLGIHNYRYVRDLLDASIAELNK